MLVGVRGAVQRGGVEGERERVFTRVCVPFVFVMGALLFADELLVHDFFELDHLGGGVAVSESGEWRARG